MKLWQWFTALKPRRTFEAVVRELVAGLRDGSIVLVKSEQAGAMGIGLPNSARIVGKRAIEPARINTFVIWETDGVKPTATTATEKLHANAVEYKACA